MKRMISLLLAVLWTHGAFAQTLAKDYVTQGDKVGNVSVLGFYDPVGKRSYVLNGDPNSFAIPVTGTFANGPVQYVRNGTDTEVTQSTGTPANNRPLPISILAGDSLGPVDVGSGNTSSTTLRFRLVNDQTLAITCAACATEATLSAAAATLSNIDSTASAISGLVNNINNNTPNLVSGRVPVDVGASVLPTGAATESTLSGIKTRTDVVNFGATTSAMRVAAEMGQGGSAVSAVNPLYTSVTGTVSTDLSTVNTSTVTTGYGSGAAAGTQRVSAMLGVGTAAVSTSNPVPSNVQQILGTNVDLSYGAAGSGTQRVSAMLGLGSAAVSTSNPVPTDTRTVLGTTVDIGNGSSGSGTQRVAAVLNVNGNAVSASNPAFVSQAGKTAVQLTSASVLPYFQDFSSANLTTSYTQVVASTSSTITRLQGTNNSGTAIYIATGAAASEVVQYIVMPGETYDTNVNIASSSRISIRTQTGTLSSGQFSINAFL